MRHFYKTHGKHCYLRSFQTECPKCGADVLYWECSHGSKVFFTYPPYGKLIRHYCRHPHGALKQKKKFPVIVKTPKGLLEEESPSCPACGKLFKNISNLNDHIKTLTTQDKLHQRFFNSSLKFKKDYGEKGQDYSDRIKPFNGPKFGRINIKKKE
ncbi:MAG: hypothetical protein ACXAEX_13495 [Promethearchaeota archaeon]|jgi:ribosomal protein S27AE